jgi:hypothetical protein
MGEGNENLVYPSPWDLKSSLTCRKILHETFRLYGLSSPLKIHRLGRVQAATFGSSGQHTNHYITKATCFILYSHTNFKTKLATMLLLFHLQVSTRPERHYKCEDHVSENVSDCFFLVKFIHENFHSEPVVCVPSVQLHIR